MTQNLVQYYGTGRRKSSTARVYLRPGSGRILINERPIEEYFVRRVLVQTLKRPLELVNVTDAYDVIVNVAGGGNTGQSDAIRMGIARALLGVNPSWRDVLKKAGLLSRDARRVERKKYGQPGARRRFQFSKR